MKGIIDHLNVTNREELIAAIEAGNQPDPAAQEAAQQQQQMQMAITQGQVQLLNAQAAESQSRANKYVVEAQLAPQESHAQVQRPEQRRRCGRRLREARTAIRVAVEGTRDREQGTGKRRCG